MCTHLLALCFQKLYVLCTNMHMCVCILTCDMYDLRTGFELYKGKVSYMELICMYMHCHTGS